MSNIPESQHTTAKAVMKWYEKKPQEVRGYMGLSYIGHNCDRFIWMSYRWAMQPKFPGKLLRVFNTGHREEPRVVEELRGIGAQVWEENDQTGQQWEVSACEGHVKGHLDGVVLGVPEAPKTPAVLEVKTHSIKSFNDLVAKGVRESKPQHFVQMVMYAGLMGLDRALYYAVCKDTDDLYTEWVHFDQAVFDANLEKAQRLIDATEPPPRISNDPANWQCKMCNFHPVCHGDKAAEANCRTCCHATPVKEASWACAAKAKTLTLEQQKAGCSQHLMIPALVPYADATDGGDNYVIYKHKTSGVEFSNGPGPEPRFSSAELHNCPATLLPDIADIKSAFPGAKVVSGTAFDDMESDDLDKVPSKKDAPIVRERKARVTKTLAALQAFKP